jgi:hypothetical protein
MVVGRWGKVTLLVAAALGGMSSARGAEEEPRGTEAPQAAAAAKEKEKAEAPTPAVAPAQVTAWVAQLDDDKYAARKSAQKALARAGAPALEAVAETAATGSLESSTRAVSILMDWSESLDPALHLPALEKLAALSNRPTEAAIAREKLAVVRENAAIAAIESLGGHVQPERSLNIAGVPGMTAVQVIIGPQWKGGVDGLRHVADVRRTATLSLWSAPLDDAAVPVLLELKQIYRLELYGMGISPEGIEKIEKEAPELMVDVRRGGARLGVRGLIVEEVVADSPAEKGGILEGDAITKFEGIELQGESPTDKFKHLTDEIAKCQPGDERTIEVLRQGKPVELKVTFDRWGDDPMTSRGRERGAEDDLFQQIPQGAPRGILIPQQRR